MTDEDPVPSESDVCQDRNGTTSDAGPVQNAPRRGFVAWLRERILYVGGIVGAITALVTLPGLVLSTWNGSLQVIDSWTEPDIVVAVGQLKLRCLVVRDPTETEPLSLEDNCVPGNLAVSGKFALTNHDRIARNVTNLRAKVQLLDGPEMQITLGRPLSVRHEVVNGTDTAAWFDWTPVDLGSLSTHVEEIAFDQHGLTPTPWKAVHDPLFQDVDRPVWKGVVFTVWARVFGETDELEIFRCSAQFKAKHLSARRENRSMRNRMPFDCVEGQVPGLVAH